MLFVMLFRLYHLLIALGYGMRYLVWNVLSRSGLLPLMCLTCTSLFTALRGMLKYYLLDSEFRCLCGLFVPADVERYAE